MKNIIVCIKQVPMVSELPWDSQTRTLKRDLAPGMMDPSSRQALEAALVLKETHQSVVTVVTMGPPMAEEILHQAVALGADKGILLTDPAMAGADTCLTSEILAACIQAHCPEFDLVLCGVCSTDSETGQVGPQLAEQLELPSIGYVREMHIIGNILTVERHVDGFLETLETGLPALLTIDHEACRPRYLPLGGIERAFTCPDIVILGAAQLGFDSSFHALTDSPTQIEDVFSPVSQKENQQLKGPVKQIMDQLFEEHGKIISSAMGKDLETGTEPDAAQEDRS